jgi:hypothetical protein
VEGAVLSGDVSIQIKIARLGDYQIHGVARRAHGAFGIFVLF